MLEFWFWIVGATLMINAISRSEYGPNLFWPAVVFWPIAWPYMLAREAYRQMIGSK